MSSENDNNADPDVSRIFSQKVDKYFKRDFGRYLHQHQLQSRGSFREDKATTSLLLNYFRTALSKYNTWIKYADKQMQTMKELLEEHGMWTEQNRYKIHFSYRGMEPELVTDDKVQQLAAGSIMEYPFNIEDIEGITASEPHPKFHATFVQTDNEEQREESTSALNESLDEARQPEQMSVYECRLLESEQQIERLEHQNAQMRDQLIILSERSRYVELLEEQKKDLQMQLDILRHQNDKLIMDHEKLKTAFGGGMNNRNLMEELVRNAEKLKERKASMADCKRIAQIFKEKYDNEINELRTRLNKYEPLHASDTTRILRFASNNLLDEAVDEHLVKNVASTAKGLTKANPLKRRKMEENESDGTIADLTFLAEELEDEEDPTLVRELRLQLENAKLQLEQTERENTDSMAQYQKMVTMLTGYEIQLDEDGFCEAKNVHSKDCTFLFQKHAQRPTVDLLNNECAQRWKGVLQDYLVKYHSVPAFLSAVTVSLIESPEITCSSSPATSSAVDLSEHDSGE